MKTCPHCGCSDIDEDAARGDATCMGCGTVLEESIVVTENQFQERAGGSGHTLVGQFISSERAASNNAHGMGTPESREITYAKGRKIIDEIASQLRLNVHCIDTSFNFYKMCVSRNLTRGRTRTTVVAVCLYITCRLEQKAHLLLDFSDITQINVFELGRNLTFIARSLKINLPATDPCLYIIRFACMLELGDKQADVVSLATRLVQRMKRDWMSTGRRPTGICGAALLMAARSLNFNRSVGDIVRIVHISEGVIRKRLDEFSQTPSGRLTIDEFSSIDLEHSEDPPAFREARRKAREEQLRKEVEQVEIMEKNIGDLTAEVESGLEKKRKEKFIRSPYASVISESLDGIDKKGNDMIQKEILDSVYHAANEESEESSSMSHYEKYGPSLESLGIRRVKQESPTKNAELINIEDEEISDSEIDTYILTENEVKIKTEYWMKANGEVMKAIEERKREREENGDVKKKRRKVVRKLEPITECATAMDAMEKVIHEKKLSNKINYDILKDLESFTSSRSQSATLSTIERPSRPSSTALSINEKINDNDDGINGPLTKNERITMRRNMRSSKEPSAMAPVLDFFNDNVKPTNGSSSSTSSPSSSSSSSTSFAKPTTGRYSKVKPNIVQIKKEEKVDFVKPIDPIPNESKETKNIDKKNSIYESDEPPPLEDLTPEVKMTPTTSEPSSSSSVAEKKPPVKSRYTKAKPNLRPR